MAPLLLYSANPLIKFTIQQRFFGHVHYVWCSDTFDARTRAAYDARAHAAPSSTPRDILQRLREEVERADAHSDKIRSQRLSLKRLAARLKQETQIDAETEKEIVFFVNKAPITFWRPLLYVIPYSGVASRARKVPPEKRASIADEFIIPDLSADEFDVIEV